MSKVVLDNEGNEIAQIKRRPSGCGKLLGWILLILFVGGVILMDLQAIGHWLASLF